MFRSIQLQSLLYRGFLSSALIPLLVIELCLLLMYFGANRFIFDAYQNSLLDEALQGINQAAELEADSFNQRLRAVDQLAAVMAVSHEAFFASLPAPTATAATSTSTSGMAGCSRPMPDGFLQQHANGAWFTPVDNGGASVYYASHTPMTVATLAKAWCSESLDVQLKAMVEHNDLVTQAYLNTRDDMNRIYPFMADAAGQYGPDLHMQDYNFYYLADAEHNPQRQPVWTGVYLDPAGQGWMASVVAPVYQGDRLEGVSGLDITIDSFVSNVLQGEHRWNGGRFLVDAEGMILAMPPEIESLLQLQELKSHVYQSAIDGTVEKPEAFNLLKSGDAEVRLRMGELLASPEREGNLDNLVLDSRQYLLNAQLVEETGWRLITVVDRQALLAPMAHLKDISQRAGFIAIVLMAVFYLLFFLYLEWKSRRLAEQVSQPMKKLSQWSQSLGANPDNERFESVGIAEIDQLYLDVNRMSSHLEEKTRLLVDSQMREQITRRETEQLEEMAATDRLSGLYNRHKLDQLLLLESERAMRSGDTFCVILMDIDHFKTINDNFGHTTGDHAIVETALFLQQSVRKVDYVGRWGGEEFMILCPMTELAGGLLLAESLRSAIAGQQFTEVGQLTASFGVASWDHKESIKTLIQRADEGLYAAKDAGRNHVGCTQEIALESEAGISSDLGLDDSSGTGPSSGRVRMRTPG